MLARNGSLPEEDAAGAPWHTAGCSRLLGALFSLLAGVRPLLLPQCRNPIHRAHYELFIRALEADNVKEGAVCLVHPTCGPTQDDDIPGEVPARGSCGQRRGEGGCRCWEGQRQGGLERKE